MTKRTLHRLLPILVAIAFLVACGGGGNSGSGSVSVISEGVMTKGSVIVNGVTFNAAGATITKDDNPATEIELEDGMVVKVKGHRNDDGVTGEAERIEAESELRGEVTAIPNTREMSVLSQIIVTDDLTVYDTPNQLRSDIQIGNNVEVHGSRDRVDGLIRASRIELLSAAPPEVRIKGNVSSIDGPCTNCFLVQSCDINNICSSQVIDTNILTVSYIGYADFAAIADGDFVEVEGVFNNGNSRVDATKIALEDVEDAEFEPAEGQEVEYEGYVDGFTVHPSDPGTFTVDGKDVKTTASTIFLNGTSEDLVDGVKVEVEGHVISGVLNVEKVKFKRPRVRLEADVTATNLYSNITLTYASVGNVTVFLTIATDMPLSIPLGRYEVRGYVDSDTGFVTAEEIKSAGGTRDILQGPVEVEDSLNEQLTILNKVLNLNTVPANEFYIDDVQKTEQEFYDAITADANGNGTIVKVRDDDLNGDWDVAEVNN